MKPEEQRIAIAEACGWRVRSFCGRNFIVPPIREGYRDNWTAIGRDHGWQDPLPDKAAEFLWPTFNDYKRDVPPDYLNDLNAMHEAEKVLNGQQTLGYITELIAVSAKNDTPVYFASAVQRAEAFLRTLNRWTENQP